jgi:hypothetical protein
MASVRKKYQGVVDHSKDPVTTAPIVAAQPPPAVEPKPIEEAKAESDPVKKAERSAIEQRLEEMRRAESLQHEAVNRSERFANDPDNQTLHVTINEPPPDDFERAISHLSPREQGWVRANPKFLSDPELNAKYAYAARIATREANGDAGTYCDRMEDLLGLRQQASPRAATARQSAPVSAPPSRDSVSVTTGKPINGPTRLTPQERADARLWKLTDEQYLRGKQQRDREKAGGFHQDG